jgi:hypothetical protein
MKMILAILLIYCGEASMAAIKAPLDYKGKYLFTRDESRKYPVNSKCMQIGPRLLKALSGYKSCHPFKGENPPLLETTAKCEKTDQISAYIFEKKKICEESVNELSDGDST